MAFINDISGSRRAATVASTLERDAHGIYDPPGQYEGNETKF
jgi:hypothetical protein